MDLYQKTRWTIADEKHHIARVVKHGAPANWLHGYLTGLQLRHRGFNGRDLDDLLRTELKLYALEQMNKHTTVMRFLPDSKPMKSTK